MSTYFCGEPSSVTPPWSDRDHVQGAPNAALVVMKYGDYQCRQSRQAHQLIKALRSQLGDQVCLVFRHFPQPHLHSQASRAAESAEASAAQGKFWEMHDLLFEHQHALDDGDIVAYAAQLDLDIPRFLRELSERVHSDRVAADVESGELYGVKQAPTVFISIRCHDVTDLEQLLPTLQQLTSK